jgi:hypothetical protein
MTSMVSRAIKLNEPVAVRKATTVPLPIIIANLTLAAGSAILSETWTLLRTGKGHLNALLRKEKKV